MLKKATLLFIVPLYILAAPLKNISPIEIGYTWEFDFKYMWGGHFLENGHEYTTMETRRIITVDSLKILSGGEGADSTLYYFSVYDSGIAYIATDSIGEGNFDTLYFDTLSTIKDSVIYTTDTVITFCEIFLKNYKTDEDSLSIYNKDSMDTMKTKIEFCEDSLNCYIEQYEHFDGQQYDKREFYFVENIGAVYLYNISSFFCAVQEYYYNLISFNGFSVIDTTDLFDQIGKYNDTPISKHTSPQFKQNSSKPNLIGIYNIQGKLIRSVEKFHKTEITKKLSAGTYFIVKRNTSGLKNKGEIFVVK